MSGKAIHYKSIHANVTLSLHEAFKQEAERLNIPMNVFFVRSIRAALPQTKRKYVRRQLTRSEA